MMSSNGVVVDAVGVGAVLVGEGEGAGVAVRDVASTGEAVVTGRGRVVRRAVVRGTCAAWVARAVVAGLVGELVGDGLGAGRVVGEDAALSTSDGAESPGRSGSTNANPTSAVRPPNHRSTAPGNGFQLERPAPNPSRATSRR